jgi:hypothetical protein
MARKDWPLLGWIRELPEVGDVTRAHADRELELMARRSKLLEVIAGIDRDIETVRDAARDEVATQWTRQEIAEAKRRHTGS